MIIHDYVSGIPLDNLRNIGFTLEKWRKSGHLARDEITNVDFVND